MNILCGKWYSLRVPKRRKLFIYLKIFLRLLSNELLRKLNEYSLYDPIVRHLHATSRISRQSINICQSCSTLDNWFSRIVIFRSYFWKQPFSEHKHSMLILHDTWFLINMTEKNVRISSFPRYFHKTLIFHFLSILYRL